MGHKVREAEWFGPDMERHREIVTFLLESIAGASCERLKDLGEEFAYPLVSGRRRPKTVSFCGDATSLSDVDEIAERLRDEVTQMLRARRQ